MRHHFLAFILKWKYALQAWVRISVIVAAIAICLLGIGKLIWPLVPSKNLIAISVLGSLLISLLFEKMFRKEKKDDKKNKEKTNS